MAVGMGPSRGASVSSGGSNYTFRNVPGQSAVGNWNTGGGLAGWGNANGMNRAYQPPIQPAGLFGEMPRKPMQPPVMQPPPVVPPQQPPAPPPNVPGSPGWEWRQSYQPFTSGVRPGLNWNNNAGQWPGYSNNPNYRSPSQGGGGAGLGNMGGPGRGSPGGGGW